MIQKTLDAFWRRYNERRLIEADGSNLIQWYGRLAEARALEYDARGQAYLYEGRREGHWWRVARCVSRRPPPTRPSTVYG